MKKLLFLFLLPIGLFGQINLLNAPREGDVKLLQFDGQYSKEIIKNALGSPIDLNKYINSRRKEIHNKYIIDKLNLKITNGGFDGKGSVIFGMIDNTPATKIDSVGYVLENCPKTGSKYPIQVFTFGQLEAHKIWENTLEEFGFQIGYVPLNNRFEKQLFNYEKRVYTDCYTYINGVPFAVNNNGINKQLREVNADYIIILGNYGMDYFSGTIHRAKDLIQVADFYSDLNFSYNNGIVGDDISNEKRAKKSRKLWEKAYRLRKKIWNKSKKVEGKELTRDDFIYVIFNELIKSSEKIYEDLSKIKSEAYVGMKSNEFLELCKNRVTLNPKFPTYPLYGGYRPAEAVEIQTTRNFNPLNDDDSFEYSKFRYVIEQYDSNGKVIDRLLISDDNEIYQDKNKDGTFSEPYSLITSIERDPIFEKN